MGSLDASWQDDAACRTEDPDLFFPEHAGARLPTSDGRYVAAKAVCAGCPVVAECLAFALSRNERFGVWGGTTPEERKLMTDHRCPRCMAMIIRPLGRGGWNPKCDRCVEVPVHSCRAEVAG